jgi:hypothetical protein
MGGMVDDRGSARKSVKLRRAYWLMIRVVPEEKRARHVRRVRARIWGMWYREMQILE